MNLSDHEREQLLTAADQAYDTLADGAALHERSDTPAYTYPEKWRKDLSDPQPWTVLTSFDDAGTGFHATVYRRDAGGGKVDLMVACRGTRGPNAQDLLNDLSYGWNSWKVPVSQAPLGAQAMIVFLRCIADLASKVLKIVPVP